MSDVRFDALLPQEMATKAEYLGVRKSEMPFLKMFMLAVLAGAFISLGAVFATTVSAGSIAITASGGETEYTIGLPYGLNRLIVGLVFSLGLILVIVGGAELFTGNNLIAMAWISGKVKGSALLRNWGIVYLGNFVGAMGTVILMFMTRQHTFGGNSVGIAAMKIGVAKIEYSFIQAVALGILCNGLVCLAVWLSFSARSTVDKIAAIIFPVTAFVAAGFEHSIANMYFIPYALFIKMFDPAFISAVRDSIANLDILTWQSFVYKNLIPVTVGNMIGGVVLVAVVYWMIFLRSES